MRRGGAPQRAQGAGSLSWILAVTRERDGSLALGGSGTPVDRVVEMTHFDQEALFDRLAAAGQLDRKLMPPLAAAIAEFHRAAERRAAPARMSCTTSHFCSWISGVAGCLVMPTRCGTAIWLRPESRMVSPSYRAAARQHLLAGAGARRDQHGWQ